ncbi:MAG TPA: hypothetical protein VFY93_09225 [Planctomycetota bacterium]|nr:hypothetical protein [Planctomycetota bacterium]
MRRQALDNLRAAIEANTERRTLEQLKAQGKRSVRVVSGEKVMQIITAIVNDVVDREVGDATERDRDRIVHETKSQFDRVLKIQADQEALLQEQRDIATQYRDKLEAAQAEVERVRKQIEDLRAEEGEREAHLIAEHQELLRELNERYTAATARAKALEQEKDRLSQMLEEEKHRAAEREERQAEDYDARVEAFRKEQEELVARLQAEKGAVAGRQEQALSAASAKLHEIEERAATDRDARVRAEQKAETAERDAKQAAHAAKEAEARRAEADRVTRDLAAKIETQRVALEAREREVARLTEDLAAARAAAGKADDVRKLEEQLSQMHQFLRVLDERSAGANEATVQALVEQLSHKQTLDTQSLEAKFNQTLDASLEKFTKTVEAATAKPIDIVVEATDVLVDKIFDTPADQMSTNLDSLEVDQKKSKRGIGGNLAALRAMRAGKKPAEGEKKGG